MAMRLSEADAAVRLGEMLGQVCRDRIPVIIERDGQPVAVLISPDLWEEHQRIVRERFAEAVEQLRTLNAGEDPDEIEREVTRVVEEVRRERYEQRQL